MSLAVMSEMTISKSQIDRLGDRLREGTQTDDDLRLLDDYRHSFGEAFALVIQTLSELGYSPTPRLTKSTRSIAEKLRRETIRLSQVQDIAGCRVVLPSVVEQDSIIGMLQSKYPKSTTKDLRSRPRFGYRAVHIIVEVFDRPIEVQVRSELQHLWAELSEKSADVLDPAIKYGGGPREWHELLEFAAREVESFESKELEYNEVLEQSVTIQSRAEQALECTTRDVALEHSEVRRIELEMEISELTEAYENLRHAEEVSRQRISDNRDLIVAQFRNSISWMNRLKEQTS